MARQGICSSQTQLPLCPFTARNGSESPGENVSEKKGLLFSHLSLSSHPVFPGIDQKPHVRMDRAKGSEEGRIWCGV